MKKKKTSKLAKSSNQSRPQATRVQEEAFKLTKDTQAIVTYKELGALKTPSFKAERSIYHTCTRRTVINNSALQFWASDSGNPGLKVNWKALGKLARIKANIEYSATGPYTLEFIK